MTIRELYDQPGRHYHTWRHITEGLQQLRQYRAQGRDMIGQEAVYRPVVWAWLYHDAYLGDGGVARSADLAATSARERGYPRAFAQQVATLVLCTDGHRATTYEERVIVCLDFRILGSAPRRFWEYEAQIRAEYSTFSAADYRRGRAEFVRHYLLADRPKLFPLPYFEERYELPARRNLSALLARLEKEDE